MDIHVNKASEIPLHEQVAGQIVFLIGTGRLRPGTFLPSVRALAQRLGIHRNTINKAYRDLTLNRLVDKQTGRRFVVRNPQRDTFLAARDLDDLVHVAVSEARRRGYSLQQLYDRLREHSETAPPDHLLVLSDDAGMRMLLPKELGQRFRCPIDTCTPGELLASPARSVGALVVSPQGHIPRVRPVLPPQRPAIAITYASADDYVEAVRRLETPSLVAVVSVSAYFLEMARRLLAPAVGRRHSMQCYLLAGHGRVGPRGADFVVCDFLTYPITRSRCRSGTVVEYRLMSTGCLDQIASLMRGQSI